MANQDAAVEDPQTDGQVKEGDGESSSYVPKIEVLRLEISSALKDEAVQHLIEHLQKSPNAMEKDIATSMKKHFDQTHGPTWHCLVGKRFGCSVAYDTQHLLFFRADQHYVLLFKSID